MVNSIAVSNIRIRVRSEIKGACVPRNPGRLRKLFIVSPYAGLRGVNSLWQDNNKKLLQTLDAAVYLEFYYITISAIIFSFVYSNCHLITHGMYLTLIRALKFLAYLSIRNKTNPPLMRRICMDPSNC
jgi:hypothetical protein